jgi:hypothetical protein
MSSKLNDEQLLALLDALIEEITISQKKGDIKSMLLTSISAQKLMIKFYTSNEQTMGAGVKSQFESLMTAQAEKMKELKKSLKDSAVSRLNDLVD